RVNLTQRIQVLMEETRDLLTGSRDAQAAQPVLEDLAELMAEIEELTAEWQEPPESLKGSIEALDLQFYAASELYLDACETLEQALQSWDVALVERAQAELAQAGKRLKVADDKAHEQFAK
ncbi:unnamed protein product, partial [Phaeothamnion confervicola]